MNTKYVITIVKKVGGAYTASAFITNHPEVIDETEGTLEEDEIMFVNEFEPPKS